VSVIDTLKHLTLHEKSWSRSEEKVLFTSLLILTGLHEKDRDRQTDISLSKITRVTRRFLADR